MTHSGHTLRSTPLGLALLIVVTTGTSALGQAGAGVPDPDPEKERKALQVPEGFEISLFAADPLLAKPIQMNFDSAGRLWIATSETYPQIKPGQKANDKILILEDTDGDGKADKVTVFADGLLIPTGIEPGDGGVYVGASTELLHLSRPDGDKGALRRRVVLSGFGTEDTHHIVHTLRWGHDGMLYFNQSIYIHSHIETPFGVRRLGGGGIWQFRPETGRLEVFARGWWNSWGHHFDRFGQSFITDGAGGEGVNYGIPGASYTATPGAVRVLTGLNPGHPKYCGCEIVSGRHMPEAWRGTLVTNDFRANRVCRFSLVPDGSGYAARQEPDVVRSTHPAFRPVDVKMGPDGALYIADWYNPIIQHGEVDFRDPRRDHTHGRIWRITAKGRPLVPRPRLVDAKNVDLLDALRAEEAWTRHHARRVLKERGAAKVVADLDGWTAKLPSDAAGEPLRLEALWTYQSLDIVKLELLQGLLGASDHRVRAAAVRVAGAWHDRMPNALTLLVPFAADQHPQVRLEAIRALSLFGDVRAADAALKALDFPLDRNLDYALWLTLRELESQWLPALEKGTFPADGSTARLLYAVQSMDSSGGLPTLVRLVRSGKLAPAGEATVLGLLAERGGPGELGLVLDRAIASGNPAHSAALLAALERTARSRNLRPAGDLLRLNTFFKGENEPLRAAALRLAGAWKLDDARPQLADVAQSRTATEALRIAALDGLVALGNRDSAGVMLSIMKSGESSLLRRKALLALLTIEPKAAAAQLSAILGSSTKDEESSELFNAFLERKDGVALLTEAIRGNKLPKDVAKVGVRLVRTSLRPAQGLIEELTRAGNLTTVTRTLTAEQMTKTMRDVTASGDPARGEGIFRRKDMLCLQCHAIGGAGGQVGPDLSSIGASAPVDYLIDSLFLPSKAIKENYHSLLVTTTTGRQYTGVKVRQTKDALVLRTAEDKEVTILVKEIDEQITGGSLMPEGLVDGLTRQELLDLVKFLSELGKVGAYSVGKARVVRRWQVLEGMPENERALSRGGAGIVAGDDPSLLWGPAYSKVSGILPLADLPQVRQAADRKTIAARLRLDATAAGKVRLRLALPSKVSLWLDGKVVTPAETLDIDLTAGIHTITVAVDAGSAAADLRCDVEDIPGSPARVAVVGGK
jgi:putative heme-binding domain-containing protein